VIPPYDESAMISTRGGGKWAPVTFSGIPQRAIDLGTAYAALRTARESPSLQDIEHVVRLLDDLEPSLSKEARYRTPEILSHVLDALQSPKIPADRTVYPRDIWNEALRDLLEDPAIAGIGFIRQDPEGVKLRAFLSTDLVERMKNACKGRTIQASFFLTALVRLFNQVGLPTDFIMETPRDVV
jgi:hypothetical protein